MAALVVTRRELLDFLKQVVVQPDGCWAWSGIMNANGYTYTHWRKKIWSAHKFAYEVYKDRVPVGLELDHLCRVTWCVNPEHLEAVTHKVNRERGSAAKLFCRQGHLLDADNTYHYITRDGILRSRYCKQCRTETKKQWRINQSGRI